MLIFLHLQSLYSVQKHIIQGHMIYGYFFQSESFESMTYINGGSVDAIKVRDPILYFGASASLCLYQTELKNVSVFYDRPLLALMCRHFSSRILGGLTSMVVL